MDVEKVDWDKVSVKKEGSVLLGPGPGDGTLVRPRAGPHVDGELSWAQEVGPFSQPQET